jgi:hypothetical protein
MKKTFTTIILQHKEGGPTGIELPPEIIEAFGAGKKPPVKITLKGYTYRTTVATMGGKFMMSLSKENREAAGVKGGEKLSVTVELDTEPRTYEVPDALAKALAKKKGARAAFDALSPSKRKEFARQVNEAKAQETRDRRIANIVEKMG